jgi:hypothetical protein
MILAKFVLVPLLIAMITVVGAPSTAPWAS